MKNSSPIKKFLLVSAGAVVIDFVFYMLLSNYMAIGTAKLISTTISCVYAYFANKHFTFTDHQTDNNTKQVLVYIGAQIINISCNTAVNAWVYDVTQSRVGSYLAAIVVGTIVNYMLQRYVVFRKNSSSVLS